VLTCTVAAARDRKHRASRQDEASGGQEGANMVQGTESLTSLLPLRLLGHYR
jgi:hypothetical protein